MTGNEEVKHVIGMALKEAFLNVSALGYHADLKPSFEKFESDLVNLYVAEEKPVEPVVKQRVPEAIAVVKKVVKKKTRKRRVNKTK